jgi:ribosomal-protein-serine acetyltransferase
MLRFQLTDDAYLRLWETDDADELHELIAANHAHLAPWMPWVDGRIDDTRAFIASTRQLIGEDAGLQTAIVERERIIGSIGTNHFSREHRGTELGYWIAADAGGRGLMTRAVTAYLDQCFGPWALERVAIGASVDNARSRAVAERLGFTLEGVLRRAFRVGEEQQDVAMYALLRAEWLSGRAAP